VRVFFLGHTEPDRLIETITLLNVLTSEQVFGDTEQLAIVLRGSAAGMELTANLLRALDGAPGSFTGSPEFRYSPPRGGNDVVRVFYLANAATSQRIQPVCSSLRLMLGINKVFYLSRPAAIAVRGTADDIAAAEWLIQSLDIPADAKAARLAGIREFHVPATAPGDAAMRVFYAPQDTTPAVLQQSLKRLYDIQPTLKSMSFVTPAALIVRGSADQVAQSEQTILEALHTTP